MTRLSVNINKIATLRNARGGNIPNVKEAAVNCQRFGAQGITVHPRPDERHIRYQDVKDIKPEIYTELNIEGFPSEKFLDLVQKIRPHQVTLVPDSPETITSDHGWDVIENKDFLTEVIQKLHDLSIRSSLFIETDSNQIRCAAETHTDRIELYTEPYAKNFRDNKDMAIEPFIRAAEVAAEVGLGLNSGHDLNLENLKFYWKNIPGLLEVSIGHALISDALYFGMENTIQLYLRQLSQ